MNSSRTSTSVMQRRLEPRDSLDDFPTPPWATRALCEWLSTRYETGGMSCREPAANRGFMVRPLREYFSTVVASDIHDYGAGFPQEDYLSGSTSLPVDWTITNPPFRLAQQFIECALRNSGRGVAVIVRTAFLEGKSRYEDLFSVSPPTDVLQFVERVPMVKGMYNNKASTATAYCWLVWDKGGSHCGTRLGWIPPCRKALELPKDCVWQMQETE